MLSVVTLNVILLSVLKLKCHLLSALAENRFGKWH